MGPWGLPVAARTVTVRSGVELACWDTGGPGAPVVLTHAAWGSGELWAPQLRAFSSAGHRTVAWSRRGHFGSGTGPPDPGRVVDDLEDIATALGLTRFHLVGTGLGGFGAVDYALTHPDRVLTLTMASTLAGLTDPDWVAETRRLVPPVWEQLPVELRELSAAYRHRNPLGATRWEALTARAVHTRVVQSPAATVNRAELRTLTMPVLFVTGDADPYLPPGRMVELAALVPGSSAGVVEGAGHSPAWENPSRFDELVLGFVDRVPSDPTH